MTLNDFLLPNENIKFNSKTSVKYGDKKYNVLITDMRLILYAQRGHISKSDDIVSERLDKLKEIKYCEKGLIFRSAKISIQSNITLDILGPCSELKQLFTNLQFIVPE
ncbi:MAG: hypothetical protein ACPKPY_00480 [Nitrososphaeraceae archaeon]